jgi:uracil-DNA glycosylase family 4
MFIYEAPGNDEDHGINAGRPMVGATGKDRDKCYLKIAGLQRDEVYTTNAMKCMPRTRSGAQDTPDESLARHCAEFWLPSELQEVQPEIVVLGGAVAVKAVCDAPIDLEMYHGLPILNGSLSSYLDLPPVTLTHYHPASGLRDARQMTALVEDHCILGRILHNDWSDIVLDEYPNPIYVEVDNTLALDIYMQMGLNGMCRAGVDTEDEDGRAWCVTVSVKPGTGIFIDAQHKHLLHHLASWLEKYLVILHNAPHDLPIMEQMAIRPKRWVDTMEDAYWLQLFRIGLKVLAYRLCGMAMEDFDQVTEPSAKVELYKYMSEVVERWTRSESKPVPKSAEAQAKTNAKRLITNLQRCNGVRIYNDSSLYTSTA